MVLREFSWYCDLYLESRKELLLYIEGVNGGWLPVVVKIPSAQSALKIRSVGLQDVGSPLGFQVSFRKAKGKTFPSTQIQIATHVV